MTKYFSKKAISVLSIVLIAGILSCDIDDSSNTQLLGESSYENFKINKNTTGRDRQYLLGDQGRPDDYKQFLKIPPRSYDIYPSYYNWADKGKVTVAKDQKSCGSCWAFASTGAFESKILMKYNVSLDLSEQQQVACNVNMNGCGGGNSNSLRFWEKEGPMEESGTGYNPNNLTCSILSSGKLDYRTKGYYYVNASNVKDMKESLITDGPTYFAFAVYSDFYSYWNNGGFETVYTQSNGILEGRHAVLIIGWDDSKNAWLCKNSWGATKGPNGNGTFWISYDGHLNSLGFYMANIKVDQVENEGTFQAENYGSPVKSFHAGYKGTGYVAMGRKPGTSFTVNGIRLPGGGGQYRLSVRYAMAGNKSQSCSVMVNGRNLGNMIFTPTSSLSNWNEKTKDIRLDSRTNFITIEKISSGFALNIDYLNLEKINISQSYKLIVENGSGDGSYTESSDVVIKADEAPNGQSFDKWEVVYGDISIDDKYNEKITIVMSGNDVKIRATYKTQGNQGNLIENGSFELRLSHWTVTNGFSLSRNEQKDGYHSLKMSGKGRMQPANQTVNIEPGSRYKVIFWIKVTDLTSGNIKVDTAGDFDDTCQFVFEKGTNSRWKKVIGHFDSKNKTKFKICLYSNRKFNGTCYFDNFSLTRVD